MMARLTDLSGLLLVIALASSTTAQAQRRIPSWCAYMGGQFGFDCSFYSFEQCMATARGLGNSCAPNPRYLAAAPQQTRRAKRARKR
jgi:hypothetical protein